MRFSYDKHIFNIVNVKKPNCPEGMVLISGTKSRVIIIAKGTPILKCIRITNYYCLHNIINSNLFQTQGSFRKSMKIIIKIL